MSEKKEKVSRRSFVKYVGVGAVAVGAASAAGYYLTKPGPTPITTTTTATSAVVATSAAAVPNVKIGAVYPLTGEMARQGGDSKIALELARDIINGDVPNSSDFPFSIGGAKPGQGLPHLGGAKIEFVWGDAESTPDVGRAEAERLVTQGNIAALIGSYSSGIADPVSAVTERYKVPMLCPDCVAPSLTERGFKYFFRTTPTSADEAKMYFGFVKDLESGVFPEAGKVSIPPIQFVGDTEEFGTEWYSYLKAELERDGYKEIGPRISFKIGLSDATPIVLKLKQINPEFLFLQGESADDVLMIKALEKYDVNPKFILTTDDFQFPEVYDACGNMTHGWLCRALFSLKLAKAKPWVQTINDMFVQRSGEAYISDTSIRGFTGMIALANAIDRAGSTDHEAIRQALVATDIPGDQLPMPWPGIKFNEKGQNIYGITMGVQRWEKEMEIVWPQNLATHELMYPLMTWSEKRAAGLIP